MLRGLEITYATLEMSSLPVMDKRNRGKKQQEETGKQQHVIVIQNYLKVFLQKVFEITTESSPTSLTETVDGSADLPARNLTLHEEFQVTLLSSLPDYFWS